MFMQFNDAARLVMRVAELEARQFHHPTIGTERLLLALLQLHDCVAVRVLAKAGIDKDRVRLEVAKSGPASSDTLSDGRPFLTPECRKAIEFAIAAANRLGHSRVGTGHLLLGLLEEATGLAFQVLCRLGIGRLGGNLSRVAEHVVAEMNRGGQ
jgi:ATP-dependent Clp protease ATP-binding subunit ClpC